MPQRDGEAVNAILAAVVTVAGLGLAIVIAVAWPGLAVTVLVWMVCLAVVLIVAAHTEDRTHR